MRLLFSAALLLMSLGLSAQTDLLTTQKGTTVAVNTWTRLPYTYTAGVLPRSNGYAVTGFDKAFYVPALDRMCHLGNFREPSSEPNRAWLCYSFAENNIAILEVGSTFHDEHMPEGGHPVGAVNVDPVTSTAYGPCCFSGSQVSDAPLGGAYVFDFTGMAGRNRQSPSRLAWYTQLATGGIDPRTGTLITYGGQNGVQNTALYNPATNVWEINVSTSGTPPPSGITEAAMAFNSADGKLYLFGGRNADVVSNSVYSFDVKTNTWNRVATSGPSPVARYAEGWAYSEADNVFLAYSGYDAAGTILNDTWIFDPGASRWTQVSAAGAELTSPPYERVAYFPTDDVFVAFNAATTGPEVWAFRWRRTGTKAGNRSGSYRSTDHSLNRTTGAPSWARPGGVASDGSVAYVAWTETGGPNDLSEAMWSRPYVVAWKDGTATQLGSDFSALSNGNGTESTDVSIAAAGDNHSWACWHEQSVNTMSQIQCKGWDGTAWKLGGLIGRVGKSVTQGQPHLAFTNGAPTVVFKESSRDKSIPYPTYAYVKQWNGNSFVLLGNALNVNDASTVADSVAISSDSTGLYAAFTEYVTAPVAEPPSIKSSPPQVYLKRWNGSSWTPACGGSANLNPSERAFAVSTSVLAGVVYIAFTERTDAGLAELYVRKCDKGKWSTLGNGPLNRNAVQGWAFRPELANDGKELYVVWDEQGGFAESVRVYAAKWDGTSWRSLGGALNSDTSRGSAAHPSIGIVGATPVVAWGEIRFGGMRQMYLKKWNGTDWVTGASPHPVAPTNP